MRAGSGPQHHTCMSASSSCLRRRMFSSSWHSSGVRSLGTEQRHGQVSMCGCGNHPRQAPGATSAPDQQPGTSQELGCGAAACPEELGWRVVSPAPCSGQVPPTARKECEGQGIAPLGSGSGCSGGAGHRQFLLIQPEVAGQ